MARFKITFWLIPHEGDRREYGFEIDAENHDEAEGMVDLSTPWQVVEEGGHRIKLATSQIQRVDFAPVPERRSRE